MKKFMQGVKRFIRDEEGVTAIEYGLLAALIAVVLISGAKLVGSSLDTTFTNISACLGSGSGTCPP